MNNSFYILFNFLKPRKPAFFVFLSLLTALLIYLSFPLELEEDISKLIPQSEETKTLNRILKYANFSDKIVVNISINDEGNKEDLLAYAEEILDSLETNCSIYIKDVIGKIEESELNTTKDFIVENLPLFLSQKDYDVLYQKFGKDSILQVVQENYHSLISPSGLVTKDFIRKDPFGMTFVAFKRLEDLKFKSDFEIDQGFLMSKDKRNVLLFISPVLPTNETDRNGIFVDKLLAISHSLNLKYAGVAESEYYGSTVIAVSNANQIKTDIKYTISLALTVLMLILIFFYRRIEIPLLLFIPSALAAMFAITALHFLRPSISAISLGIGSVLLGITLDYSLHILTHYRKNRDVQKLYSDVTKPVLMSSITTAVAFLCLTLLKSRALQDLGLFASISVVSASILALIIIPLTYIPPKGDREVQNNIIDKFSGFPFDRSKALILIGVIVFVISVFTSQKVQFNKDLNSMNYQSEATLRAEQNLESVLDLNSKSVYLVAYSESEDEVVATNSEIFKILKALHHKDSIVHFASNGGIVLSEKTQLEKLNNWNSFWTDSLKRSLRSDLIEQGKNIGFKSSTYEAFYSIISKTYEPIQLADYRNIKSLMTDEYLQVDDDLKLAVTLVKLKDDQKDKLQKSIAHIPNTVLIDRKEINETFLGGLKDDFSSLINYSIVAVLFILFVFYRNIELTLLTAFPIIITWILTLGLMGLFGIEFTIFNVIISTLIFGLGVDYSIFMTNALVKDYTYGTSEIKTYKTSIVLSVITTVLGVGVLVFAKHPALKSISWVSLIGINIAWFVVFVVQPLIFRLFVNNRVSKGFAPINLRLLFISLVTTLYYAIGGIVLSISSLLILPLIPISKKKKFSWLHKLSATLVQSVLYLNPFVKKRVINPKKEKFDDPAIIISNHSSALDTLTIGLLSHKVIYLVNDWVYKSPIFGILAKVMGYYPVSSGVEDSTSHLREKIKQGYSLVVFPEGKRSFSNKIGRFHKGAFYLQEELGIDILPIYLHGNAEVMPKNDFIIYDGGLTVWVGDRIKANDADFGTGYKERNKKISQFYKHNFLGLRDEFETANYFRNILYFNYSYKSTAIASQVKIDFELNKAKYKDLNEMVPFKVKMAHLVDDYGQIDILLVLKSLDRKILSIYLDKTKESIAKQCYSLIHKKVIFEKSIENLKYFKGELLLITRPLSPEELTEVLSFKIRKLIVTKGLFGLDENSSGAYDLVEEKNDFQLFEIK